jgi:voltage-gated potassium channel
VNISHIIISFFSVISILLVGFSFFLDEKSELYVLAHYYDLAFCLIFFGDFLIHFFTAKNKTKYFFREGGLLDLLGSIPVISELRFLRIFRVFRLVRAIRSYHEIRIFLISNLQNAVYASIFIVITFVIIATSFAVLHLEHEVGNIKTAQDTVWWAFITVTTVGYGDYYPITSEGKFFASILIFNGFVAFGTIISFINTTLSSLGKKVPKE